MEEKTEAVKGEETTVGLTMNYNPFSFISCQEDALVLAGCISHGLDADVIKKSGDLFATARAMLLDACVCLLYRQGGDSMSMQGLVDLLQNDISHNEDQDIPSIKAAYDKIEADGSNCRGYASVPHSAQPSRTRSFSPVTSWYRSYYRTHPCRKRHRIPSCKTGSRRPAR